MELFEKARRSLLAVYFVFGLAIMSWIPRFPQIKQGLDLDAARFGFLVSLGAVGSVTATLFMGHVVHRFGSRPVLMVGSILTYGALSLITFSPTPLAFAAMVIVMSMCISGYNVGLNAQSVLIQEKLQRPVIGRFHGAWSLGSLVTGLIAAVIAPHTTPQQHVATMALLLLPVSLYFTRTLISPADDSHSLGEDEEVDVPHIFKAPKVTWLLALGAAGGAFGEFVNGDWSTIYAHEHLGAPIGTDVLLFSSMTVAIMLGRMTVDRQTALHGMDHVVRRGGFLVMFGMVFGALASHFTVAINVHLALALACLGFFIAGLGTAPMVPAFYGAAINVPGVPVGVTLARISLAQQIVIWLLKAGVAFLAGAAGLQFALIVPAVTAIVAISLARHTVGRVALAV